MGAITPPPVIVRVHHAPLALEEGDEMGFTLWLGPLPLRWRARIEHVSSNGFTDRQLEGPFKRWVHQHSFAGAANGQTRVKDEVELEIKAHPVWGPVGLAMRLSLPLLFAYRGWKTRRLLRKDRR